MSMTEEEHIGVARALLRHPEWRGRLEQAAASDERLADVCGCYAAAWRGFEFWRASAESGADEHCREYEAHIRRIEADIGSWMAS
jgi:hypothetical protein